MLRRLSLYLFCSYFLSAVASLFLFFFTPIPIRFVLENFAPEGVEATGIDGGLVFGLDIEKLVYRNADGSVLLSQEGVHLRYTPHSDLLMKKRLVLDSWVVDRMSMKVGTQQLQALKNKLDPFYAEETVASGTSPAKPQVAASAGTGLIDGNKIREVIGLLLHKTFLDVEPRIKTVGTREFRVSSSQFEYPLASGEGSESIQIEQIRGVDFMFQPSLKSFSAGDIVFADRKLEFEVHGFSYANSEPTIGSIQGKIKVAADPDHLKEEVDFNVKFEGGSLKDIQRLKISLNALKGKIRATIGPDLAFYASFFDVTLRNVYLMPFPVSHLNIEMNSSNLTRVLGGIVTAKGDFKLGETTFAMTGQGLQGTASMGKYLFTVQMDTARLGAYMKKTVPADSGKPFFLRSNFTESSQDNLAYLYHQGRYADLDEVKKIQIDTDLSYFDRTAPAGGNSRTVSPVRVKLSEKSMKSGRGNKKLERYPASETRTKRRPSVKRLPVRKVR